MMICGGIVLIGVFGYYVVMYEPEPEPVKVKGSSCEYKTSTGRCISQTFTDIYFPKSFPTECEDGFFKSNETVIGDICVSNALDWEGHCNSEQCYLINVVKTGYFCIDDKAYRTIESNSETIPKDVLPDSDGVQIEITDKSGLCD